MLFRSEALSGDTLHTLCVEGMEGMSEEIWTKILQEMPNLHMMYVSQKSGERLPAVLGTTCPDPRDPGGPQRPILPSLKDLLFDEVDFGACLPGTSGQNQEFGARLRRGLEARKKAGSTVAELILTRCENVRMSELKAMKDFVELVDWDRKGRV